MLVVSARGPTGGPSTPGPGEDGPANLGIQQAAAAGWTRSSLVRFCSVLLSAVSPAPDGGNSSAEADSSVAGCATAMLARVAGLLTGDNDARPLPALDAAWLQHACVRAIGHSKQLFSGDEGKVAVRDARGETLRAAASVLSLPGPLRSRLLSVISGEEGRHNVLRVPAALLACAMATQPGRLGIDGAGGSAWQAGQMASLCSLPRACIPRPLRLGLVTLPRTYDTLYAAVQDRADTAGLSLPALCLITGRVVLAGRTGGRGNTSSGPCTRFSESNTSGVGIWLVIPSSQVVLMHGRLACYYPSVYLDKHGEEDVDLRRGQPLHLSEDRLAGLERLWISGEVRREVMRRRDAASRIILEGWY